MDFSEISPESGDFYFRFVVADLDLEIILDRFDVRDAFSHVF